MKAVIKIDGTLKVIPETQIEEYALKKWFENYISGNKEPVLEFASYNKSDTKCPVCGRENGSHDIDCDHPSCVNT